MRFRASRRATSSTAVLLLAALIPRSDTNLVHAAPPADATFIDATTLDHVALNVADLKRSADWYNLVLGLEIYHKWDNAWMLQRGPIHLGLYTCPACRAVTDTETKLLVRHFAFAVSRDTLETAQVFLKRHRIPFDGPRDIEIATSLFLHDPDGYEVELISFGPAPAASPAPASRRPSTH